MVWNIIRNEHVFDVFNLCTWSEKSDKLLTIKAFHLAALIWLRKISSDHFWSGFSNIFCNHFVEKLLRNFIFLCKVRYIYSIKYDVHKIHHTPKTCLKYKFCSTNMWGIKGLFACSPSPFLTYLNLITIIIFFIELNVILLQGIPIERGIYDRIGSYRIKWAVINTLGNWKIFFYIYFS